MYTNLTSINTNQVTFLVGIVHVYSRKNTAHRKRQYRWSSIYSRSKSKHIFNPPNVPFFICVVFFLFSVHIRGIGYILFPMYLMETFHLNGQRDIFFCEEIVVLLIKNQ